MSERDKQSERVQRAIKTLGGISDFLVGCRFYEPELQRRYNDCDSKGEHLKPYEEDNICLHCYRQLYPQEHTGIFIDGKEVSRAQADASTGLIKLAEEHN